MFRLVGAALIWLATATFAQALGYTQTGRVTFVDDAAHQLVLDNAVVSDAGDFALSDLHLGEQIALTYSGNALITIARSTDDIVLAVAEAPVAPDRRAAGLVTYFN